MKGSIRQRGKSSYQLRYYVGVDRQTGKDIYRAATLRGTKRQAQLEMSRLVTEAAEGTAIAPNKLTANHFFDSWAPWVLTQVAPKTGERYVELVDLHARPAVGNVLMQELEPMLFTKLYTQLAQPRTIERNGRTIVRSPLSARTIGHLHRTLHVSFDHAVTLRLIRVNPVAKLKPPRVEDREMEILKPDQLKLVLTRLVGHPFHALVTLALASGARLGELLALRWGDCDLDAGTITIARSLEQTKAARSPENPNGLRFKSPKTKAGRRTIEVAPAAVAVLRMQRRLVGEQRLALGLGAPGSHDLVFPRADSEPQPPKQVSTQWGNTCDALELPDVTFHGLRHTHASACIARGMDSVTLSKRIGHSSPAVTMRIYAHLFDARNDRGASIMQTIFDTVDAAAPTVLALEGTDR